MHKRETVRDIFFIVLPFVYVGVLLAMPLIGIRWYAPSVYTASPADSLEAHILWHIRIPRCVVAYCAGSILALGGMVFQSMFRNPLATPFTLGVSSGCSFGAALSMVILPAFTVFGLNRVMICAFIGGMLATGIVYALTRVNRSFHATYLLLAGIAVTLFFSSMVLLVQYAANFHSSFQIFRWLIGGIETVSFGSMLKLLPPTVLFPIVLLVYHRELDLLLIGEELALSKGMNVASIKMILFFLVSLMISFVVAICGPIAFVGMIIPHICRMIIGPSHKGLVVVTFLCGGLFMLVCDTIARTVTAPAELPVGLITAFLGGPFFLWILIQYGRKYRL